VGLEPHFAAMLPDVLIGLGLDQFAAMAARALAPKPVEEVSTAHIHVQRVSVREQAGVIVDRLRRSGTMTFRALVADAESTLIVVGRFLALLELYREQVVVFEQLTPLGDLTVRWIGTGDGEIAVTVEFDVEREIDRADATIAEGSDVVAVMEGTVDE
jgi:segregation and condensation protein A